MTSDRLFLIRSLTMGSAGVICALYAVLALITGRPDPVPFWITGVAGVLAWLVVGAAAALGRESVAAKSFDEGYRADSLRAQSIRFWMAVWMYPIFGVLLWQQALTWPVAFASMGCLTAASYLLSVTWLDIEGRD